MARERNEKGQFVKGHKGYHNGGRRKSEYDLQDLIDQVVPKKRWKKIVEAVARAAESGDLDAVRILLDRRWGRVKADIDMNLHGDTPILFTLDIGHLGSGNSD